jgi:hypothetical protein
MNNPPIPKPKRRKHSKKEILHKNAWDAISRYVRARDKKCVTCGSTNQLQGGHYWHAVLDFDPMNINAQCVRCNHWLSGNLAIYASYLIKKYGIKKFKELDIRHTKALKGEIFTEEQLKATAEYFDLLTSHLTNEP